jgi:hypothetical protein
VEVLMRVYARCVVGLEEVWIALMEASLRPPGEAAPASQSALGQAGENSAGHLEWSDEENGKQDKEGQK